MLIRLAEWDDADFLLELKNDPVMRKFAVVTHNKIKKEDHLEWLKTHLHEIHIAMEDDQRIGMFRVSEDKEYSINLHPDFRGKGYGQKLLAYCPPDVWARIVNGNVASMKLFLSNGFKVTGYERNFYVLKH